MIPSSHQLKPASKAVERHLHQEEYASGIKLHYGRIDLMPADYLVVHADSDPVRVAKIRAMAIQRRAIRAAKRRANWQK